MTTSYWCEFADVDGAVQESVAIDVDGGRFVSVEAGRPFTADATVLRGLTIAGFANAHSHAFHRALRSRTQTDRGTFWTWRELMYRAASRLDPDRYFRLARATYAEMAMAGITAVGEFHYVHHRPGGGRYDDPNAMGHALLAAAHEAGIRITLLDTVYLHGGLDGSGHIALSDAQQRFGDGTADAWAERIGGLAPGSGHRVGAAIHSVRAVDVRSMRTVVDWAREHDAPLHAHVSEQTSENEQCQAAFGASPTALLHEAGALGDRFTAIHATHVSPDDIDALAASGSTVCLCPTTERDLGDGVGPTGRFAAADLRMALGTDSHAVIDVFEEARALELDERLVTRTRGVHAARELVASATSRGHRSLGWSDAGAIEVGRRADLVTVALDSVRTAGASADAALEAVVFAATAADVVHVVVDGRPVVADRHHLAVDAPAELQRTIADLMEDR
jgi:formiminoglutamate deiminase